MPLPDKMIVIIGTRSWAWVYVTALGLLGVGLGFLTSAIQKNWYREDWTSLHIAVWWVAFGLIFVWYAERPGTKPPRKKSAEQEALQQRLARLSPIGRRAFAVSCFQRIHGYQRELGGMEDPECIAFRNKVLADMWLGLADGADADWLSHLERCKMLVPNPSDCPIHDAPARIVDECKMHPLLALLESWPPDTEHVCFQLAMDAREYIDQIVMDELVASKFDPGADLAAEIASGTAWNTAEGLACHRMMKREVELQNADLDILDQDVITPAVVETLRKRSSAAAA